MQRWRTQGRSRILNDTEKNRKATSEGFLGISRIAHGILLEMTCGGGGAHHRPSLRQLWNCTREAAHHFVCPTPEITRQGIDYLKRGGRGRASFLPLTAVERWLAGGGRRRSRTGPGIIGRLSEVVSCEERYRGVAEFFLGRTYLAEELKAANSFAEDNNYRVRVVTLSGEIIQQGPFWGRTGSRYPSTRWRKVEWAV